MNRYAALLLITLFVAGLVACGSGDDDPAIANVCEKGANPCPVLGSPTPTNYAPMKGER
jgi:hypothetical protein